METTTKRKTVKSVKQNEINGITEQKPKSKTRLFWEKYPNGILEIVNMRAVLK